MLSDMIMKKKDVKNLQNRLKNREIFAIRFVDSVEDAHHVPTYDIVQHTVSVSCECQPTFRDTFSLQDGNSTIIHRSIRENLQ